MAAFEDGKALMTALASYTGADVAASDDDTGAAELGGNWDLEYTLGGIESSVLFSQAVQSEWQGLLNNFEVTNVNDSGAGSLRQAILNANGLAGADTITFNIAGTGTHTIAPTSPLPDIDGPVTIDATTDDSFAVNGNRPAIVLAGSNAGFSPTGLTLTANADGSTIRGFVVRDWGGDGIHIQAGSTNNTIAGNYIGRLTTSGTASGAGTENGYEGIFIEGANNVIGGLTAADRNVISGNGINGILVSSASGNTIVGNYIGTDATGLMDLGNSGRGIWLDSGSNNNVIGGTGAGARNVISGNDTSGILLTSNDNVVQGNYIGVGADGTTALGNLQHGVHISGGADDNLIGGTASGASNIIANSQWRGINVQTFGSTGITILGNTIYANGLTGIDLGDNGVTANDPGDGDSGANNLQNFPVLTSANSNAAGTTIVGTFNSTANTSFRIEYFGNRPSIADSPNGEGERYLGFITVTTDGSGNASFNTTLANVWVNSGDRVTATATVDLGGGNYGSTSEFAANVTATSTGIIVVDTTSDVSDGTTTSIANLGNNRGADGTHLAPRGDRGGQCYRQRRNAGQDRLQHPLHRRPALLLHQRRRRPPGDPGQPDGHHRAFGRRPLQRRPGLRQELVVDQAQLDNPAHDYPSSHDRRQHAGRLRGDADHRDRRVLGGQCRSQRVHADGKQRHDSRLGDQPRGRRRDRDRRRRHQLNGRRQLSRHGHQWHDRTA